MTFSQFQQYATTVHTVHPTLDKAMRHLFWDRTTLGVVSNIEAIDTADMAAILRGITPGNRTIPEICNEIIVKINEKALLNTNNAS